eukprot:TRINITY_DN12045_c0_g1_i2.p1 TRINITY_DN12045_c0_g1~~TRINITY_DN12045_c0_g1_i2.p1  ORF type:complete len:386 (-),score=52.63 TRINITY_DN12045_c0_g1_i2:113-1270(-)
MFTFLALLAFVFSCSAQCWDRTKVLPIPQRSVSPKDPNKNFYVENIWSAEQSAVWWATNGMYNFVFLTYDTGVVVFDAPIGNPTSFALEAVRTQSLQPVTHIIYTHSHNDHIGDANNFLFNTTKVIAQQNTASILFNRAAEAKRNPDTQMTVPLPTISFISSYNFTVGTSQPVRVELYDIGSSHIPGNIIVWSPTANFLMYDDVITPRWVPGWGLYDMRAPEVVLLDFQAVLSFPFTVFIGGHTGLKGSLEDVQEQLSYYNDLITVTGKYLSPQNQKDYSDVLSTGNYWLYERSIDEDLACSCAQEMISLYGGQLAGVDVYADTHCRKMISHLRLESPPMRAPHPENAPAVLYLEHLPPVIVKCEATSLPITLLCFFLVLAYLQV